MTLLRRNFSASLLIVWAACLAGCGGALAHDPADDAKLWQGTWTMVSCTWNGEPQPGDVQWIVAGDHYNIRLNGHLQNDPYPFTLGANGHIDVNHHDTPPGTYGGKLKGIYQISADELTVCYDLTGAKYPSSFDAGRGSRQVIYKFRRER